MTSYSNISCLMCHRNKNISRFSQDQKIMNDATWQSVVMFERKDTANEKTKPNRPHFRGRNNNRESTIMVQGKVPLVLAAFTYHQVAAGAPVLSARSASKASWGLNREITFWNGRGGQTSDISATATEDKEAPSLDEKVQAAMQKLGLDPPSTEVDPKESEECKDGACPLPDTSAQAESSTDEQINIHTVASQIAKDMNVNEDLALAALGATSETLPNGERKFDEGTARGLIQQELDMIGQVSEDSEEVKQLVSEGFDPFLSRRALALAELNMEDARAILIADQQDEEEEAKASKEEDEEAQMRAKLRAEAEAKKAEKPKEQLKTVTVDANFDPTAPVGNAAPAAGLGGLGSSSSSTGNSMKPPSPAKKEDVVFDATTADVQKLVMESPVPVLLDIYADWCGPCKALTPALEEMAVKAGGIFRLVKINTDNERPVSSALEVTSLPTVFGIKDGQIVNMFQGMPRGEDAMKNFMMGLLMPGASFDPPVTQEQKEKFNELSSKLAKTAGAAGFSFSAREKLQDRTIGKLDELVDAYSGDMAGAEDSAKILRSLMSNIIRNPFDMKFRKINLANKVISAKIASYPPCLNILKSIGFASDGEDSLVLGKSKKVVNVAPFAVARDCIDKWIDKNRYLIAAAARKRKDEIERARLAEIIEEESDVEEEEVEDDVDPNACTLKLRLDGKKKVHEVVLNADDPLSSVVESLPVSIEDEQEVQLICAAKRLVVKSSDEESMSKSLRDHGLMPTAAIVIKVSRDDNGGSSGGKLAERAAAKKKQKKGSHTMQSIGIYAKDDNNKAELIDGGGGVWYEHDITDDESEEDKENEENATAISDEAEDEDEDQYDSEEEEGDE